MKLGEGGEAFFVFETSDEIPESLQTSPVISPATSPQSLSLQDSPSLPTMQEPEFLDLNTDGANDGKRGTATRPRPMMSDASRAKSEFGTDDLNLQGKYSTDMEKVLLHPFRSVWTRTSRLFVTMAGQLLKSCPLPRSNDLPQKSYFR